MYPSFHFCSVVCPVVCGCQGHPFCTLLRGHRLSRAPSSAAGPSPADMSHVSHPVPNRNMSLWGIHLGRTWRGKCVWKWLCLNPRVQQEKSPIRQRADALILIFRPRSLAGSYCSPISLHLVELSGSLLSLLSSIVVGGKQSWDPKGSIDVGWLSSFAEKVWIHLSHLLILVPDTPKEMIAALFERKVASSYTWHKVVTESRKDFSLLCFWVFCGWWFFFFGYNSPKTASWTFCY